MWYEYTRTVWGIHVQHTFQAPRRNPVRPASFQLSRNFVSFPNGSMVLIALNTVTRSLRVEEACS